jgi:hypothetical protein
MQTKLERRLNNLQWIRALKAKAKTPESRANLERIEQGMFAMAKHAMKEQDPSGTKM